MPTPPRPQPVALRIELLDVVPVVWRRVVAPDWWIQEGGLDADSRSLRDDRRVSVAAVVSELGAHLDQGVQAGTAFVPHYVRRH